MTSDFDISQYLGIFLDEAEEQIQILDESIILLEQDKENMELLNKIFRAAHTLKGSSASMGFDKMAHLTHAMENVLDRLRHRDLAVSTEIVNLLLEALDNLQLLKNEIVSGQDQQVNVEGVIAKLKKAAEGVVIETLPAEPVSPAVDKRATEIQTEQVKVSALELDDIEKNVINSAEVKGYHIWHVAVKLAEDCLMKAPRAYIVFNNLKDAGEVIKTIPSIQEIEEEKFDRTFELVLISREDADTVANIIKSVSEIDSVAVVPVVTEQENKAADPVISEKSAVGSTGGKKAFQGSAAAAKVTQTVRVDVQRLENLMNLVGELVIDRTRLLDVGQGLKNKLGNQDMVETMEEVSVHIGRITTDLQEEIMKARMFPIEQVFNRFPRMVRDLAQKAGKEVDFIVEGRETELDRTVIEEIGDPLIHLLRNSIDHGIESPEERKALGKPVQGTVRLNAFHRENQIIITVEDDGRGIDADKLRRKAVEKGLISPDTAARLSEREAINLIFLPGFSTAKTISDVSGRGVGMDIVRNHIEKINGIIDIETVQGKGTRFTIKLPLTLAINRSLLVYLDESVFAFPLSSVVEIINVERKNIQRVQKRDVVLVRGEVLPLVKLRQVLHGGGAQGELPDKFPVVVCGISEKRVGLVVDALLGEQEIVIKSLGEYIGQVAGLAGATIMGDGRVALILDVRGLIGQTGVESYAFAG
ncbi:chemotaxis protein CheA [Zhaonella formicivorans]|uniref:chemotaxis protein CheA n=1 Tax=Zhaonella formicivorans TaxID=2528593 RepID=UPI0010E93EBF|nr:chemotaxis protein CheA [Zhaonella formicivorans]